jgi:replicative DNA helicase
VSTDQIEFPSNIESERALLGSILLDESLCEQARICMTAEWFYSESHKEVFRSILRLYEQKQTVNTITISEDLKQSGCLDAVGGIVFLHGLSYGLPAVSNLMPYVLKIKESARKRAIMKFSDKIIGQAADDQATSDELAAKAIDYFERLRSHKSDVRGPFNLDGLGDDQIFRYERYYKGVSDALPVGFPDIDNHLLGGGFTPNGLYVLAAATSMGKTSLALDIAANIAETGHRVYYLSREMSRESIFDRLVAVEGDIARWKLRPGIYEPEYVEAKQAVLRLTLRPIVLDDASATVADVRGHLREYQRRDTKVDLLVVDYLQLMVGAKKENRNQEVGSISRSLKELAMEFQMSVLSLSQLSRNHARERREPELHDLRESGDIEQDADAVFFLFGDRPEEGAKYYDRGLKCSKNREGALFRSQLTFNGELVTYRRPRTELTGGAS